MTDTVKSLFKNTKFSCNFVFISYCFRVNNFLHRMDMSELQELITSVSHW